MKPLRLFWQRYRYYILTTIVVMAALYSIFNKKNKLPQPIVSPSPVASIVASPQISPVTSPGLSPSPISQEAEELIQGTVLYPELDQTNQHIDYASFDDATLSRVKLADSSVTQLADGSTYLTAVAWSPNHKQVVTRTLNGQGNLVENPFFQPDQPYGESLTVAYNLETGDIRSLNRQIQTLAFLGDNEIIYQFNDGRTNVLSVAKPDGSGWRNLRSLTSDIGLLRVGQTVLLQEAGQSKLTRYGAGGKVLGTLNPPTDLQLSQSAWAESGNSAIYWVEADGQVTIKQWKNSATTPLTSLPEKPDQMTILWDNKTGAIYVASFDGLTKLSLSVKP